MKNEYYIVPKDVIGFKEEVVDGLKSIHFVDGKEVYTECTEQKILPEASLLSFTQNTFTVDISLVPINKTQLENLQKQHRLVLNEYQSLIKISIESTSDDFLRFSEFESQLRKYVIFSFLLANKKINVYHYEYGKFIKIGTDGQGIFLPFSFIKLTKDMYINTYYESSYEKMTFSHSYCRIEDAQIEELKRILDLLLIRQKRNIPGPIEDMFIHINTISWVVEGFFYPALVTLFTCFESLLFGTNLASLLGLTSGTAEYSLFEDLKNFRDGIVHNESHIVYRNGGAYICKRIKDKRGNQLATPVVTNFDLNKLEQVRVKLVEKLIEKINT